MKPWLFDILACPIDKHYPLKLYIFKFETNRDEFRLIVIVEFITRHLARPVSLKG